MSSEGKKARFSLNQKLTIVTVVLVITITASPIVYAIVEPHILITMDSGQTTKPLQINDNFNVEVFSVDVDGTIFPAPPVPVSFEGIRGAEEIVLNNNFDDGGGGSTFAVGGGSSGNLAGAEFTMPTTAPLWKFTKIETRTGAVVNSPTKVCGTIVGVNKEIPLSAGVSVVATRIALGQAQGLTVNTFFNMTTKDSIFVDGGEDFIVIFGGCGGTNSRFADQTRTNTWSTLALNADLLFLGQNSLAVITTVAPSQEYYVRVFAVPYT